MTLLVLKGSDDSTWEFFVPDVEEAEARDMVKDHLASNGGEAVTWEIIEAKADSAYKVPE